eukprot:1054449-Rhodomonas_salina.1
MEGWESLIPDSMVQVGVCTMLELLGNGFNNPATTKELVTALQQRRSKGWLATLTIDCAETRAALVNEMGAMKVELEGRGGHVLLLSERAKMEGTPPEPIEGTMKTGVRQQPGTPSKLTSSPAAEDR